MQLDWQVTKMNTYQYPDGTQLTSTALTDKQIETFFQYIAAQLLGILTDSIKVTLTLATNSQIAPASSLWLLYNGELVSGPGIPPNTLISGVGPGNQVILSNNPISNGDSLVTVTDPNAFAKVRIGWQKQGQPGPSIDMDTCFVRCAPIDTPYSRLRDNQANGTGPVIDMVDVFTRTWQSRWTFYGPNALNNAKAIQSGMIKVQFATYFLAANGIYCNPSISEPERIPENFQGQWWERMDMVIEFNEQITETLTVGSVKSVEVQIYNETGEIGDLTITAPS